MKKNFYLFRHGVTDWNIQRKLQGSTNIPLNEQGVKQAENLIDTVKNYNIELIVSSTLERAYRTAIIASTKAAVDIIKEPRLQEMNLGDYEGTNIDEMNKKLGEDYFRDCILSTAPECIDERMPNGETKREATNRGMNALEDAALKYSEKNIGIFSHGLMLKLILASIGVDMPAIGNGAVIHLVCNLENNKIIWEYKGYSENSTPTSTL